MTVRQIQALRLTTVRAIKCLYVCMHACKAMVHCRLRPLPGTPRTMDSSSLGAHRRLRHNATNTTMRDVVAQW